MHNLKMVSIIALLLFVVVVGILLINSTDAYAEDRFWVNGSGNWTDNASHWSNVSGGAAGALTPTAADNAYFDVNSSLGVGWTVTVDAAAYCLDLDFTGSTNSPTLTKGAFNLDIYGNVTFITAMTITLGGAGATQIIGAANTTLTMGGAVFSGGTDLVLIKDIGSKITLLDTLTGTSTNPTLQQGELDTNGKTLNIGGMYITGASAKTLTLGNSTINSTDFYVFNVVPTVTANTAFINLSGASVLQGLGTDFNGATMNLTGATSTVSGNNSFSQLNLVPATTQSITFTAGTTQNVSSASLSGSAGHVHTLTSAGNWSIVDTNGGTNSASYVALRGSQASGGTFIADYHSTDNGNNSGWVFQKSLTITHTGTGSITTPAGDGTFAYNQSTVATLVAVAGACYHWVNWTGDTGTIADATDATTTITMDDSYDIVANFAITTYNLTIASDLKGTVSTPAIGTTVQNCGDIVPIIAVPNTGYTFGGWTGDTATIADTTLADTTITIGGDYSITATYTATASYAFINTTGVLLSLLISLLVIFLLTGYVINEVKNGRTSEGVKIAVVGILAIVVIETIIIAFF